MQQHTVRTIGRQSPPSISAACTPFRQVYRTRRRFLAFYQRGAIYIATKFDARRKRRPGAFPGTDAVGKDVMIDGADFRVMVWVEKPKGAFGMGAKIAAC